MRQVRGLYGCGFSKDKVREFFRLIDWVLALTPKLEYTFQKDLCRFEKENQMPYITSIERVGRKLGRKQGRKQGIKEGRLEGKLQGKLETARELMKSGVDPALIAKATGLNPEDFQLP